MFCSLKKKEREKKKNGGGGGGGEGGGGGGGGGAYPENLHLFIFFTFDVFGSNHSVVCNSKSNVTISAADNHNNCANYD